MVEEEFK